MENYRLPALHQFGESSRAFGVFEAGLSNVQAGHHKSRITSAHRAGRAQAIYPYVPGV